MIKRRRKIRTRNRRGAALLVVLIIVMFITVVSLGFLSRSDVELATGQNMVLRTQMDYLAESGLEHAKGLILNPQDISQEYWTGAAGQQLDAGSDDYYDVAVFRDESDPTDRCNYIIDCNSYRLDTDGEKTLRSNLTAELRLDPVIALWTNDNTTIFSGMTINGDMRCNGTVSNSGSIGGDVFADSITPTDSASGQRYNTSRLSLAWPDVTVADFQGRAAQYESGNYTISSDTDINGMLVVNGDLTIDDSVNVDIEADKNLPALYVNGDLIIDRDANLDVNGLAVVEGGVLINGDADLDILGGLFMQDSLSETAADSSAYNSYGVLHGNPLWGNYWGRNCLWFDGSDDYIQTLNNSTKLQVVNDYTISVWTFPGSSQKTWAGIISKCNSSGSTNHWTLQFNSSSSRQLIVHHPDDSWSTGIDLNDLVGAWHHIAIVRNGNIMTSYLDGVLQNSGTFNDDPDNGYGHLNIGCDRTASSSYVYRGLIDDVQIYNCDLDVDDINNVIRLGGTVSGLIGRWRFDESGCDVDITAAPEKTAIFAGSVVDEKKWSQAAGAFYRSIERP